jgi:hypothetical protein
VIGANVIDGNGATRIGDDTSVSAVRGSALFALRLALLGLFAVGAWLFVSASAAQAHTISTANGDAHTNPTGLTPDRTVTVSQAVAAIQRAAEAHHAALAEHQPAAKPRPEAGTGNQPGTAARTLADQIRRSVDKPEIQPVRDLVEAVIGPKSPLAPVVDLLPRIGGRLGDRGPLPLPIVRHPIGLLPGPPVVVPSPPAAVKPPPAVTPGTRFEDWVTPRRPALRLNHGTTLTTVHGSMTGHLPGGPAWPTGKPDALPCATGAGTSGQSAPTTVATVAGGFPPADLVPVRVNAAGLAPLLPNGSTNPSVSPD